MSLAPSTITSRPPPSLSVVIPTFRERGNVAELVRRLDAALAGVAWEAIYVDDNSPDGTADAVKEIARNDPRVRCLLRIGRRGLAGACIEGMLSSSADHVAVIDADLQHDETILPLMLRDLVEGKGDLVAATRYVDGGDAGGLARGRDTISRLATRLAQRLLGITLSDPMSGFFMMRRDRFDDVAPRLSPVGFKILLDIVTAARPALRVVERPYVFGTRFAGESKFDAQVGLEFLGLLLNKMTGGRVDPRFLYFALVGVSGIAVNVAALEFLLFVSGLAFTQAQSVATYVAMTSNFLFNNMLTYRDRRLHGWAMLKGFVGFCAIGTIGALANIGVASWLYEGLGVWWLAGVAGALMGALWNYSMSTLFVWRAR